MLAYLYREIIGLIRLRNGTAKLPPPVVYVHVSHAISSAGKIDRTCFLKPLFFSFFGLQRWSDFEHSKHDLPANDELGSTVGPAARTYARAK